MFFTEKKYNKTNTQNVTVMKRITNLSVRKIYINLNLGNNPCKKCGK